MSLFASVVVAEDHRRARSAVGVIEAGWYLVALLAIVGLALVDLYQPLNGDTALFLLGADEMAHGKRLYVEFWDNKQPGIFAFFYVSGQIFGYSERGVHLLELLWVLTFSAIIFFALRRYFTHSWLSALVPLSLAVIYYTYRQPAEAAQIEFLVGFPIFVSGWLLLRSYARAAGGIAGCAAAGVLAGLAVTFKLILAPIFVVFVLLATFEQVRWVRPPAIIPFVAAIWLPFTFGVAVWLLALAAVFAAQGTFSELLWNSFVYPRLALDEVAAGWIPSAPVSRLVRSATWYLACFAPLLPAAAVAVWRSVRKDEPALTRLMIAWLLVGMAVIVMQRFSWWTYHMLLLFVPTAVLGIRGLDCILIAARPFLARNSRAFTAAAAILCLPPLAAAAAPLGERISTLSLSLYRGEGVAAYQQRVSEAYATLMPLSQFLRQPGSLPGDIYVFGSPLIYLFSGRGQALPLHGWAWGVLLENQWQQLPPDLETYRPVYVFVDRGHLTKILHRNPAVLATIERMYILRSETEEGRWYQLRAPSPV